MEQQVQLLHAALRQCLGLLHCVTVKEEEEWGELEGDYETMRKNVRVRLEHLLYSTKDLGETEDTTLEVTPDHKCNEVQCLSSKSSIYISPILPGDLSHIHKTKQQIKHASFDQ